MREVTFKLVDHFDTSAPVLTADHMGDGMFVVAEQMEDGQTERVCLTVAQIAELYRRANLIYGGRGVGDMASAEHSAL